MNLQNKKKLLITLGCSHTEGYGCWDETTFSDEMKTAIDNCDSFPFFKKGENLVYHTEELLDTNRIGFHEKGWPMQLGKLLKVDKVVNISIGSSSNSGVVKLFFDNNLQNNPYKDYDVLVVWLMTEPFRISFYIDGKVRNFQNTNEKIFDSYLREISKSASSDEFEHGSVRFPKKDVLLENIFYFKIIETVCEKNEWRLVGLNFDDFLTKEFVRLYNSKNYYGSDAMKRIWAIPKNDFEYWSKICGHMTEKGYGLFANDLLDTIKLNHSGFMGTNINQIEMEYLGEPISY